MPDYESAILQLTSEHPNTFAYLKTANKLLSNPITQKTGRELVIRALNAQELFKAQIELLRNLVRKAGLYPYLKSEFNYRSLEEELALDVYKTPYSSGFVFHSMQFSVYDMLMKGHSVVLSAPTSMGKSAIVDSLIATGKFKKIVLIVPTIALIDETRRRIAKSFGSKYKIIHHGSQITDRDRVIYVLTQERVNERDDLESIDLFVIDEFYKLAFRKNKQGDTDIDERTVALNIALSKLLTISKQFYMIGPYIESVEGLKAFSKNYFFVPSEFNTVAVDVFKYDISSQDYESKNKAVKSILNKHEGSTIIYCKSSVAAGAISSHLIEKGFGKPVRDDYTEWVEQNYDTSWEYLTAIKNGIGLHYGGLPRALQQYTVDLFNSGAINYLICTSTIIEGVNTVARNVIIYDNLDGIRSIDRFTHNNIKGRAGRMGVHFVGNVFCLEKVPSDNVSTKEVMVPLGDQNSDSPLNMLVGVQPDHMTDLSSERVDRYITGSKFSRELLKKHSAFRIETLEEVYNHIEQLPHGRLLAMCFHWLPDEKAMDTIANILLKASWGSLRNCGLTFSAELISAKLFAYLNAESYQDYMKAQILRARAYSDDDQKFSKGINNELKIVSNLYGYTVPKTLALIEDIVKILALRNGMSKTIDYSKTISLLEHYHLPPSFAALEEMGIPVQTLQKLVTKKLAEKSLDVIARYLRANATKLKNLTIIDRKFIRRALIR